MTRPNSGYTCNASAQGCDAERFGGCTYHWKRELRFRLEDRVNNGVAETDCGECLFIDYEDVEKICDELEAKEREIAELKAERFLLAKLAADEPMFYDPMQALAAQGLRDRVLLQAKGNPTRDAILRTPKAVAARSHLSKRAIITRRK